jgi:imidazolonepropionase
MRPARSGLNDRGRLAVGQRADIALWDIVAPAELCYWMGGNRCRGTVPARSIRQEAE